MAGHTISGLIKPRSDPEQYTVEIPGMTHGSMNPLHPIDGWPLDPFTCIRKIAALSDRLMQIAFIKITGGGLATYQDVIEMEKEVDKVEASVPARLQARVAADGKSLETVVQSDPLNFLLSAFLCSRLATSRVRLHRMFIFPKKGVSPEERRRHLDTLLQCSRRHLLAVQHFPLSLNMHPLMLYSLVNTAVACALVLIINHQSPQLLIDEDFFIVELRKVINLFDLGKRTIATTMARRAVTLLNTLVEEIEYRHLTSAHKSWDRRKKGPAATLKAPGNQQPRDDERETRKTKRKANPPPPLAPTSFQPSCCASGIPGQDDPYTAQAARRESGCISSPECLKAFIPSSTETLNQPSSTTGTQRSRPDSNVAFSAQPTPPLVSSHPIQRPGFSTHSSSSHLSPPQLFSRPGRSNSTSTRPVAVLPQSLGKDPIVEFGSMDPHLDHYKFDFPPIRFDPYADIEAQVGGIKAIDGGRLLQQSDVLDVFNPEFLFQFQSMKGEEDQGGYPTSKRMMINGTNLKHFQPTFDLDIDPTASSRELTFREGGKSRSDLMNSLGVDQPAQAFSYHYDGWTQRNSSSFATFDNDESVNDHLCTTMPAGISTTSTGMNPSTSAVSTHLYSTESDQGHIHHDWPNTSS